MFIYSLSGLQLTETGAPVAVEVEDNETTARTAMYQTLGRMFLPPDDECWELAHDGRWAKELDAAGTLLAFPFDPGEQPDPDGNRAALEAEYERLFVDAIRAGAWFDDASSTHDEVVRFYEYFGLKTGEARAPSTMSSPSATSCSTSRTRRPRRRPTDCGGRIGARSSTSSANAPKLAGSRWVGRCRGWFRLLGGTR